MGQLCPIAKDNKTNIHFLKSYKMKQLSLNVAKNVTINELACTPNTIVLAKQTTSVNAKTADVTTSVRYIEVCKVEKTDSLTVIQSLLKYVIAEFFVCNELERDFAETNIKQRKLFNQFLSGNTIYRTNSEGKIASAVISEVPLGQTALRVKGYHAITSCKKENLKAAIYQHAKAIQSQTKYLRLIIDKAETIDAEPEKATEPAAPRRNRASSGASARTAPAAIAAAPAQ